jgi:hypothetical protein
MEYTLKDKIPMTKEFLDDLANKSWQEIEYLQNQIANIEAGADAAEVIKLLKNLLTSYYVFTGGLESLTDSKVTHKVTEFTDKVCVEKDLTSVNSKKVEDDLYTSSDEFEPLTQIEAEELPSEPFEYFVDFDEPIGEPLTDDDLYN